jgi:hypothetical protein
VLVAPTFLPVRAHVSFVPLLPPRLIFVGVTDRPLVITRICEERSTGDADGVDFWASIPVCGPPRQRTFGRRGDPALGFASCRVVGHPNHLTMVAVHRPGSTPLPITSLRNIHAPLIAGARSFLSAHGLARRPSHHPRPLRLRGAAPRHRADVFACDCEVLSLRAFVVALQRLDGADALPT